MGRERPEESSAARYQAIAGRIERLIREGALRPGDAVGVEPSTFWGVRKALAALGLCAVELPLREVGGVLDLEAIEETIVIHDVRASVFMTRFSRPGAMPAIEQSHRELVALHTQLEVPIIEDDVLGDLSFGPRALPLKAHDEAGMVLHCSSFSKTVGPGLRVGWCAAGRYRGDVVDLKKSTSLSAPYFGEAVFATLLESGEYRRHLTKLRQVLREAMEALLATVHEAFPPGMRLEMPAGGFSAWLELPMGLDAMRLFDAALTEGICFPPGILYSRAEPYRRLIHLSVGAGWTPALEAGVRRLGALACALREAP